MHTLMITNDFAIIDRYFALMGKSFVYTYGAVRMARQWTLIAIDGPFQCPPSLVQPNVRRTFSSSGSAVTRGLSHFVLATIFQLRGL